AGALDSSARSELVPTLMLVLLCEHPVGHLGVGPGVDRAELASAVVGEDVGALDCLALEVDGREYDDLVAVGDEIVRLGPEVLAPELGPQLSDRLLAVVGSGQSVVTAHHPLD